MSIDKQIKQLIEEHIAKLKTHKAKEYFTQNPLYPEHQKDRDLKEIQEGLNKLKSIYSQIEKKIKKIRNLISDITDQSTLCAVYLIYGKVLRTWEAVFLLSSKGYNFEIMELIRSINENLDLIKTFHLDKEQKYLTQWFQGEIIGHRISRELGDKFLRNSGIKSIKEHDLSPYDISTDVYRGFSKYTHCSYAALIAESVDVFNEDFDWNGYAGTHYTLHNIGALENTMATTLITLKLTYQKLGDTNSYKEIDNILIDFAGPMDEESLKDLIPKIKK